jgi:hypothetical protein
MWQVVLSVRSNIFPSLTITTFSSEFLKQELKKATDQMLLNYKLKNFRHLHCFNFKFHAMTIFNSEFVSKFLFTCNILSNFYQILRKVLFLERTDFFCSSGPKILKRAQPNVSKKLGLLYNFCPMGWLHAFLNICLTLIKMALLAPRCRMA